DFLEPTSRLRSTCCAITPLPALFPDEINPRFRWSAFERGDDRWPGARAARAHFETAIRTYRRPNVVPLVRRILRDQRNRRARENLFCGGLPMFSRKSARWRRPSSCSRRDPQWLALDE